MSEMILFLFAPLFYLVERLNNLATPLLAPLFGILTNITFLTSLDLLSLLERCMMVVLYAMALSYVHFFSVYGLLAAIIMHLAFGIWLSHHLRLDLSWVVLATLCYAEGWWCDLFFFTWPGHFGWLLAHACAAVWVSWELLGPIPAAVQVLPVHTGQVHRTARLESSRLERGHASRVVPVALPVIQQVDDDVSPVAGPTPSSFAMNPNILSEALAAVNAKLDRQHQDLAAQIAALGECMAEQHSAAEARLVSAESLLAEERHAREVAERAGEASHRKAIIYMVLCRWKQFQQARKPIGRPIPAPPVKANIITAKHVVAPRPLPPRPDSLVPLALFEPDNSSVEHVGDVKQNGSDKSWERLAVLPVELPAGVVRETELTLPVDGKLPPNFLGPIGDGSFGDCYKYQQSASVVCVVKRFAPKHDWARFSKSGEEKEVARLGRYFEKEATLLSALDDDRDDNARHIVKYLGYWEEAGSLRRYILTGLCDGDLHKLLGQAPLGFWDVWELVEHMMKGMLRLREVGIVHCDIKPANILFTEEDGRRHYRLADLGVAELANDRGEVPSSSGTEGYQAPEVVYNEMSSHASDMWSCFIVLQHARRNQDVLAHQHAGDLGKWFHAVATSRPEDPRLTPAAKETFALMGAYLPKDRPSPEAVLQQIEEIREADKAAEEENF